MEDFKKYHKNSKYTYSSGAFPTMELVESKREYLVEILLDDRLDDLSSWEKRFADMGIRTERAPRKIRRLSKKDNIYMMGIFRKFDEPVEEGNHILLHEVSDMGNLGTIMRTMTGLGIKDLITVGNVCDIDHPKTIRASMGARGRIRHSHFDSIEEYLEAFPNQTLYSFMLSDEAKVLTEVQGQKPYTLCFGNEGSGLPENWANFTKTVIIPQSEEVDSLNLPIACAIGMFWFTKGGKDEKSSHI